MLCISFFDKMLLHHNDDLKREKKGCSLVTSNVASIYLHVSHCKLPSVSFLASILSSLGSGRSRIWEGAWYLTAPVLSLPPRNVCWFSVSSWRCEQLRYHSYTPSHLYKKIKGSPLFFFNITIHSSLTFGDQKPFLLYEMFPFCFSVYAKCVN